MRGGYSYPTLGAHRGDREALAAPVAGSLFFAGVRRKVLRAVLRRKSLIPPFIPSSGEATSTAVNPCVQGAMDTGKRAADQVLASLSLPNSKL